MEIMENLIEFGKRIFNKLQYFQWFYLFVALVYTQRVGGSKPSAPIKLTASDIQVGYTKRLH
jgi:hypothetical protein